MVSTNFSRAQHLLIYPLICIPLWDYQSHLIQLLWNNHAGFRSSYFCQTFTCPIIPDNYLESTIFLPTKNIVITIIYNFSPLYYLSLQFTFLTVCLSLQTKPPLQVFRSHIIYITPPNLLTLTTSINSSHFLPITFSSIHHFNLRRSSNPRHPHLSLQFLNFIHNSPPISEYTYEQILLTYFHSFHILIETFLSYHPYNSFFLLSSTSKFLSRAARL